VKLNGTEGHPNPQDRTTLASKIQLILKIIGP
jgi:hypothetical protein